MGLVVGGSVAVRCLGFEVEILHLLTLALGFRVSHYLQGDEETLRRKTITSAKLAWMRAQAPAFSFTLGLGFRV